MSHFHIVVFKCEPISMFLDNFDTINNFAPAPDKLYILEASFNHKQEPEKVANKGRENKKMTVMEVSTNL